MNETMDWMLFIVLLTLSGVYCTQVKGNEDYDYVSRECNFKLKGIDLINKFKTFMQKYKSLLATTDHSSKLISKLGKCANLEEPLIELENIIDSRDEVCQLQYIDRLVDFHFKYLVKAKKNGADTETSRKDPFNVGTGKSYLNYFFSLYVHEVVHTCKSRLAQRLKDAQAEHSCSPVLYKFLPSTFLPPSASLEEVQDVNEVSEFLQNFRRVEDFAPMVENKNSDGYFDVMIPNAVTKKIEDLKAECAAREPYYIALFNPIAKLAQLNYVVDDEEESNTSDAKLLGCWLATAQLCQGILRTHLTVNDNVEVDSELDTKFMTIKWGELPEDIEEGKTREKVLFHDRIEEISEHTVKLVNRKFNSNILHRIKIKAITSLKSFILRHIDIESMQKEAFKKFIEQITKNENNIDTEVAFAGRKYDNKRFNPTSIVLDDLDVAVKGTSVLWNKEFAMIASSIIAVVMTAVFVWFSLYALTLATSNLVMGTKDNGNFKSQWKEMRDKRVQAIENKFSKSVKGIHTYKP